MKGMGLSTSSTNNGGDDAMLHLGGLRYRFGSSPRYPGVRWAQVGLFALLVLGCRAAEPVVPVDPLAKFQGTSWHLTTLNNQGMPATYQDGSYTVKVFSRHITFLTTSFLWSDSTNAPGLGNLSGRGAYDWTLSGDVIVAVRIGAISSGYVPAVMTLKRLPSGNLLRDDDGKSQVYLPD
jgi:hypothetical protein